jgi:hypothetical protein
MALVPVQASVAAEVGAITSLAVFDDAVATLRFAESRTRFPAVLDTARVDAADEQNQ